jgi:hypothetical protein
MGMPLLIWRIMKTHKHLYPLITDFGNLHLAFKRAVRKTSEVFTAHLAVFDGSKCYLSSQACRIMKTSEVYTSSVFTPTR